MILWIYKDDPAGGRPCSQRGAESSESDAQFIATCLLLGMYTSSNSFNLPFWGHGYDMLHSSEQVHGVRRLGCCECARGVAR